MNVPSSRNIGSRADKNNEVWMMKNDCNVIFVEHMFIKSDKNLSDV